MSDSTVNGQSCSYVSLSNYNGVQRNARSMGMPHVPATTVAGRYVVPDFATIGYNALTHGDTPSCSGYFDITNAYGKGAESCNTQFMMRACNQ